MCDRGQVKAMLKTKIEFNADGSRSLYVDDGIRPHLIYKSKDIYMFIKMVEAYKKRIGEYYDVKENQC